MGTQHPGPVGFSVVCTALSSGQTKTLSKEHVNGTRLMWDFSYEVITKVCEGNECCKVPWVLPWVQSRCSPLLLRIIPLPFPNAISPGIDTSKKFLTLSSGSNFLLSTLKLVSSTMLSRGDALSFGASLSPLSLSSSLPSMLSPSYFAEAARSKSKNKVLRPHQCNPPKPGLFPLRGWLIPQLR